MNTFEQMQIAALTAIAQAEIGSFKAAEGHSIAVYPGTNMSEWERQLQDIRLFEAGMYALVRQIVIGLPDTDASRDTLGRLAQMGAFDYAQMFEVVTGLPAIEYAPVEMERVLREALG